MDYPIKGGDAPIAIELEANKKYAWCSCGLSKNQPLCDGNHKGTELKPFVFSSKVSETKYLCTCKQTKNPPFCDGSHK